ncbi:MAG: hypothetical protein AAGD43_07485 [Pseudomonadota bacterium]
MKFWQYLALLSGAIIASVMALASISYNATLATNEAVFAFLPLPNSVVFSGLALAFDLGMVASVFGVLHWRNRSWPAAVVCGVLFAIASLYSVHSVRGYIALNITKAQAPAHRASDVYASLKRELLDAQEHLAGLRAKLLKANRAQQKRIESAIAQVALTIQETRTILARADLGSQVSPLAGLEWFLALTLWFFNATCWSAWFGYQTGRVNEASDTVSLWLAQKDQADPEHCLELFHQYCRWCERHGHEALAQYSFYARLIELGARKFRDGRNGPTLYELP